MSTGGLGKCSKIRHIVRLRQMVQRWRNKARMSSAAASRVPSDVPPGHVAVYVGAGCKRFVVQATTTGSGRFSTTLADLQRSCHVAQFCPAESRPLLHTLASKSIW
ncbi:hypothetical protein SAY87_022241 [Trapa incisa]|uniref:Uncharacterized protein n=1 Tax=Trapa incisa TaxID=236973 RepID=A0AAN7JYA0_9MYRT|nr:hypothetical protein SAY87_022241 [Trapa incisa]